jgi:hypothetical protein
MKAGPFAIDQKAKSVIRPATDNVEHSYEEAE